MAAPLALEGRKERRHIVYREHHVTVIIPAYNEEAAIGRVIKEIPCWVDRVIVVDNGSTDRTAEVARGLGAEVIHELQRGYGAACWAGVRALGSTDVVVFVDGDHADDPRIMGRLVDPIVEDRADLVVGSRTRGACERGALTLQARCGNALACRLIAWFWHHRYTDLGPFRAIRSTALQRMQMSDRGYGWTVEMQIKALQLGLRVTEVPVPYRRRIGRSKISGTLRGVVGAGSKILWTILRARMGWGPLRRTRRPERVVIFTRYPRPGHAKTRLIPLLGRTAAASLHRAMAERTLETVRSLAARREVDLEVRYSGAPGRKFCRWLGPGPRYRGQGKGDLGVRLARAARQAFAEGVRRLVFVGTDCPALSLEDLERALEGLERVDLVIGPARDGGYYLIGMREPDARIFKEIPWGTGQVLEETLGVARRMGASVALLETRADVDRPGDLEEWRQWMVVRRGSRTETAPRISVIIPSWNEEDVVAGAIWSARCARNVEVIVVDGGSTDGTPRVAERLADRYMVTDMGRAHQMNVGARAARGEILLFLHADARLPAGYDRVVRQSLQTSHVVAGAFRLALDADRPGLRWVERLANLRSRVLRMPYGDQGLFLRRATFFDLGGFPEWPIMEDFELVRRLRRRGRIQVVPHSVGASARRWEQLGVVRTTLINQAVVIGFFLGVPLDRLAHWYHRGWNRGRKSMRSISESR